MNGANQDDRLGHVLTQVCKLLRDRVHTRMEEIGLGRGQGLILSRLGTCDGIPQAELARRTFIRPATLTEALQRMEAVGLIVRRPDPADGRLSRVYLTETGREACARVQGILQEVEEELGTLLAREEQGELVRLLGKLRAGLGGENP